MPWSVRLQDENGKPVVANDAVIEHKTIPLDRTYKLLHYIDPYGDTYFNALQMKDFLRDWDSLAPIASQSAEWELVRAMAIRCKDEPHLYLLFIGD